jgi:dihydroorotate dehydrogenase
MSTILLRFYRLVYAGLRPIMFLSSAQTAHHQMIWMLRFADGQPWLVFLLGLVRRLVSPVNKDITTGGVTLPSPLILAAGMVKGDGFESEQVAHDVVLSGKNIIPGWRSLPRLVGLVEFGSFTRWPRLGNSGIVVWRDVPTRSTQNRVGLKNPGVHAAAEFLSVHKQNLPATYGINIAVSPGVSDLEEERREVMESLTAFIERGIFPAWFTLNLSCPNTEDDPGNNQTTEKTRLLCGSAVQYLNALTPGIPLWVKIGPNLADEQYRVLMQVFNETGVRAVVIGNTLPVPAPNDDNLIAGVGGGRLHTRAVEVAALLMDEKKTHGYTVDVIACGGVQNGTTYRDFARLGITTIQYWSALVYRGPLAAALIENEAQR